jgi:hypothetical protein
VQGAIPTFTNNVTTIYIAQRISAVIDLDKIVLMDNGAIVATGKHEELLASNALYQQIYASQLGGAPTATDRNGGGRMTAATQASTQADKTTIRGRLAARKPIAPPQQKDDTLQVVRRLFAYMASGESRREFHQGAGDPPDRRAGPGGHAVLHRHGDQRGDRARRRLQPTAALVAAGAAGRRGLPWASARWASASWRGWPPPASTSCSAISSSTCRRSRSASSTASPWAN